MFDTSSQILVGLLLLAVCIVAMIGSDRSKKTYKRGKGELGAVFFVIASMFTSNVVDPKKRDEVVDIKKDSDGQDPPKQ